MSSTAQVLASQRSGTPMHFPLMLHDPNATQLAGKAQETAAARSRVPLAVGLISFLTAQVLPFR